MTDVDGTRVVVGAPTIRELAADEALVLVRRCSVGRVAVTLDGVPHVVPVNFRLLDGAVVFRSGAGTKLAAALAETPVSFEVDHFDETTLTGWSVLISGPASVVVDPKTLARVEALDLVAWAPGSRDEVVRIAADLVSGVRIDR